MLFKSNSAFCSLVMIGFAMLTSGNILYVGEKRCHGGEKVSGGRKGVRSQIGVLGKLSWPSSGSEGYFKALLWQFRKVKILFPTLTNTTHFAN